MTMWCDSTPRTASVNPQLKIRLQLPAYWPRSLRPEALNRMDHQTPFLVCDLETVRERYAHLTLALPGVVCFYAVKCNSEPELLAAFDQLGSSFEIASCAELQMLQKLGVDPEKVLYSNTVKPAAHIAESFAAGLWRYAFDSEGELYKLAQHASGAAVYVRLRVDDSTSLFPLSRKFGAEAQEARALLLLARSLGLRPYGVTFHVGSQCTTTTAWRQAIAAVGRLLSRLEGDGITLEMLNLGGGFPARYVEDVPSVDQIANTIESALHELLPYRPELLVVEPGRFLVAESAVLVGGGPWPGGQGGRELGLPGRRRLQRADGDPADGQPVALPAVKLAPRPRRRRPGAVHRHRAELRQLRHHLLRRLPAGHPRRLRPPLHRVGRRLHPQLRLQLQRLPPAVAGVHRAAMTRLRRLIATALVDSFGLSLGWTVFSLQITRGHGLAGLGLCNAAMLVGVALSAPAAARLSARLDGRELLRVTCVTEATLRIGTFALLLAGAPLAAVVVAVAASNVVAWTGYAGMRAEVSAADPRGSAMTWYMVAVAAIEAAGTVTAALLPTGPGGLVSGGLLVAVVAGYGACLLPTWLVAGGALVARAAPLPRTGGLRAVLRGGRLLPNGPPNGLLAFGGVVMLLGSGPTLLAVGLAAQLHGTGGWPGRPWRSPAGACSPRWWWPGWSAARSRRRAPGRPLASAWPAAGPSPPGVRSPFWPPSSSPACA